MVCTNFRLNGSSTFARNRRTITSTTLVSVSKLMSQTCSAISVRGDHFADGTGQMSEEKKFLRRQIKRNARTHRLVPAGVDLQIIDAQVLLISRRATQHRPNARKQLGKCKRLYQIIVGAQFQSFDPIAHAVARRQKKDRRSHIPLAQLAYHRPAVFLGQHHIDNEKICTVSPARVPSRFRHLSQDRHRNHLREVLWPKMLLSFFIFDQQNSHLQDYKILLRFPQPL